MLGDAVQSALEGVGISKGRVRRWLGDCCCEARRQKLNRLDHWSRQSVKMGLEAARRFINQLLGEP